MQSHTFLKRIFFLDIKIFYDTQYKLNTYNFFQKIIIATMLIFVMNRILQKEQAISSNVVYFKL